MFSTLPAIEDDSEWEEKKNAPRPPLPPILSKKGRRTSWIPLGIYQINWEQLTQHNQLRVRYAKNRASIKDIPTTPLTEDAALCLEHAILYHDVDDRHLNKIEDSEKDLIFALLRRAGVMEAHKDIKKAIKKRNNDALRELEVNMGEIEAGNDNKSLKHTTMVLARQLKLAGRITMKQFEHAEAIIKGYT